MRVLVTGGAGFIGSNFVHHLLREYPAYECVVLDKLTYAGNLENLADLERLPNYRFVRGDICDARAAAEAIHGADAVVHFAAETHVDRSIVEAGAFVETDVFGTFVLLEAARKARVQRFVHISTDEVYGDCGERPSREDDPLMPRSPYAASKAGADRLAFSYFCTYKLPVVITRCTNNYGPYQHPEKLVPLFTTNALENRKLPVYGHGRNTRDWIYVEDHCRALDLVLHAGGVEGEVFNVGAGEERSVLEIAALILRLLGKPEDLIQHVSDRLGHVRRHAVEAGKIRERLGWAPRESFASAMQRTIQWYLSNRGWWTRIRAGEYLDYYQRTYGCPDARQAACQGSGTAGPLS
ncbi:MAG TPA: dTDP-glucose 4,6-dehydratase [Planctomycetota bacterium]|nr:dTDP-glucose 4,6-dehydratase [Planctomycetota bacterium]HRR81535.1 dTDP-glucose 4,6-dehydratase [Planctomycetota bacterium]HRT94925.1 dTDP-glucose 4,6-dehydratase [Planctomycetota bacterium]